MTQRPVTDSAATFSLESGSADWLRAPTDRGLLELIVANLNDAVLITEGEAITPVGRRIVFVNRAFTRLTGFSEAEALERTPDLTVGPETDRGALARIQAARRELVPIREELIKYRKDGTTFWAELEVIPVLQSDGRCSHYLGVLRDISERKALSARLLEADRLATIGALLAGIAHEINNPLTSVLANVDFVGQRVDGAELTQALDEARVAADRVRSIIADLKSFSRADDSSRVPLDPRKVLDASLQLARAAIRNRAQLVHRSTGESVVLANEARLGQAFLNILLNAAQAIPESGGSDVITASAHSDGERTVIEVTDTGSGILPEIRHRIFDPFFTTRGVERTGLGLWITRDIVSSLGGSLSLEDNVPRGTVVRVTLPNVKPAASTAPSPATAKTRAKLMLIDDDVPVGKALYRLLSTRHDVELATSGTAALTQLAKQGPETFDVILCDMMMPELDGMQLYERVRALSPGVERRVVFLTGGAFTPQSQRFLASIPNTALEKPIDRTALFAAVDAIIRAK